jgi:hypothetical protein
MPSLTRSLSILSLRRWASQHRARLLWLALASFVAGFYVLPFGEAQHTLFVLLAALALLPGITWSKIQALASTITTRVLTLGLVVWLVLTLGLWRDAEPGWWPTVRAVLNAPLLLLFFMVAQRACRQGTSAAHALLKAVVIAAVLSVIVSVLTVGSWQGLVDTRFQNWMVYTNGLNPVLTGLSYGFAGIVALSLARQTTATAWFRCWWLAALLLMIAAFFTHSRCAMLGMIAGTGVLFATTNGWRRWAMAGPLLLGVALFAVCAPTSLDGAGPMEELVLRGDTGRHTIYSAIWCRMQDAFYFTFGHGLFAAEALPEDEAGSMAFHAHSMYVATFYHGGVLGLLFLLTVLFIGLQRAWACFEALRDPVWLALLAFGMVGLMFDGSMPLRLMTITRIEPLLVLFPLAMATALASRLPAAKPQTQTSAIAAEREEEWRVA